MECSRKGLSFLPVCAATSAFLIVCMLVYGCFLGVAGGLLCQKEEWRQHPAKCEHHTCNRTGRVSDSRPNVELHFINDFKKICDAQLIHADKLGDTVYQLCLLILCPDDKLLHFAEK